jgi:hypothetical protein
VKCTGKNAPERPLDWLDPGEEDLAMEAARYVVHPGRSGKRRALLVQRRSALHTAALAPAISGTNPLILLRLFFLGPD